MLIFSTQSERIALSYYYHIVIYAPPESKWSGTKGTINLLRHLFKFGKNKRNFIRKVLVDSTTCKEEGREYN